MKGILHQRKKNVFQDWVHSRFLKNTTKYIWPQICYDISNSEPIHIVLEKNTDNCNFIHWPFSKLGDVDCTNIDFTVDPPLLDDGSKWDFSRWHINALQCRLMNNPSHIPNSFWDWRRDTRPQGNWTCDLDYLCVNRCGKYIGIEATEIYYVDKNENIEIDVYEHFRRLFTFRKGKTGGFNVSQLRAQKKLIDNINGNLYMLFHKLVENKNNFGLYEDKVLLLEIEDETISEIQQLIQTNDLPANLRHRIEFFSIENAFKKMDL